MSGTLRRTRQSWEIRALELLCLGFSYGEVAARVKKPKTTVFDLFKKFEGLTLAPGVLRAYEQHRPALLNAVELRLMRELVNEDKIEKASLNNVAFSFTQTFNARRLESNQSTANIALHTLVEQVERDLAKTRAVAVSQNDGEAGAR